MAESMVGSKAAWMADLTEFLMDLLPAEMMAGMMVDL
jgi:hypothetical protein